MDFQQTSQITIPQTWGQLEKSNANLILIFNIAP